MSVFSGKRTFMMILVVRTYDNQVEIFQKVISAGFPGSQNQKSVMDLFFDRR